MTLRNPRAQRRPIRRAASATVGAVLMLVVLLGTALPAQAHSELTSSTPADGSHLADAPTQVTLTFSQDINPQLTALTVTVGAAPATRLSPTVTGPTLTAAVPPALPSVATSRRDAIPTGADPSIAWRLTYRVVSADGHPISGSVSFTVAPSTPTTGPPSPAISSATTPPGSATSEPSTGSTLPTAAVAPPAATPTSSATGSLLLLLTGTGLAALLAAAVVAAVQRSRRRRAR